MLIALTFLIGLGLGGLLVWLYLRPQLMAPAQLKDSFATLAAEALQSSSTHLLQLAQEKLTQHTQTHTQDLEGKKALIDANLSTIKAEIGTKLEAVTTLMQALEKDRESKFSQLHTSLTLSNEQISKLHNTTTQLTAALTNSRTRGQWGERMAEDVLRLAGMLENLHYRKQAVLTAAEGHRPRPDFTFLLPAHKVIHMDVKFPLDSYLQWLQAEESENPDSARKTAADKFISATRQHIKSTSARDYRSAATETNETPLDYLLIFIPNEQVYAFLLQHAPDTINEALAQKVILCSPTTLLAVLAVIHQAMHNFSLEQRTGDIFKLVTGIREQWGKFTEQMSKIGDKLAEAQKAYDALTTTRTNMLDRQFNKLELLPQPEDTTTPATNLLSTTRPTETLQ